MKSNLEQDLIEKIKNLRGNERAVVAELIGTLSEIYTRKLYLEAGYPSLYSFCEQALGYSSGAAWRRCAAAKVILKAPVVLDKLRSGELNLCAVAELSKVISEENCTALVPQATGKSKKEVQLLVAEHQPAARSAKCREIVRVKQVVGENSDNSPLLDTGVPPVSNKRFTITLELTEEEMEIVNQAQVVLSTRKVKDTLLKSARKITQHQKKLRALREKRVVKANQKSPTSPVRKSEAASDDHQPQKRSRHLPEDVRHQVVKRDGGRCSYVAADGTRCCETKNLEFDHVRCFALGGESTVQNLRLVCRGHNRLYAEQVFGRATIENMIDFRRQAAAQSASSKETYPLYPFA